MTVSKLPITANIYLKPVPGMLAQGASAVLAAVVMGLVS